MSFNLVRGILLCGLLFASAVTAEQGARRRRSDDTSPIDAVVEHLSQQMTVLSTKLFALEAKTTSLAQKVAFHAYSTHNPVNAASRGVIVLNHAVTNVGNAYDTLTGIFTAPVSGIYEFQASILAAKDQMTVYNRAAIYVETHLVAVTISDSRHGGYDHGTMKAVVHLTAGQRVFLKNYDSRSTDYYDGSSVPYTTFSGFLISAD